MIDFCWLVGYACTEVGLNATNQPCGEGFYCLTGSDVAQPNGTHGEGGLCPEGYFCPEGKTQRVVNKLYVTEIS